MSSEQTVAILDSVAEVIDAVSPEVVASEPQGWLIPLLVTVFGGIATTIFGVWYTKRKDKK